MISVNRRSIIGTFPRCLSQSRNSLFHSYTRRSGTRRLSTNGIKNEVAFVFDIDGVLLRGKKAIPSAKPALELLNTNKIPYILLTNGGGVSEKSRVEFISKELNIPISPSQIVQSHTPMKALAQNNLYNRVMVVGGPEDKARYVALEYGFKEVITPGDIIRQQPSISPHHRYTKEQIENFTKPDIDLTKPIEAVLIFNDPRDAGTDVQIVCDILNSVEGLIGTKRPFDDGKDRQKPSIPIIFSNNDFVWANDYPLPRFGQGAFRITVEALYSELNQLKHNEKLESTIMGKPFKIQYDFAHSVLINWRNKLIANDVNDANDLTLPNLNETPTNSPFKKIYMVGDNPASDIQGANQNGWESILLRTGVFKDDDWNHIVARPTAGVFDNVYDSVKEILLKNGYN